jgi:uncharacterized membrane protein SpoIIM required for sporulation
MREGKFLKNNLDRWEGYMQDTTDPDTQANQFVNLIDDLSFSKTFYPKSTTTQFLNGLAAKQYQAIYTNKKQKGNRFVTFWKYELPSIVARHHKIYLFTLLFFIAFTILGAISNATDANFVREILGDDYVNMTQENIDKGDPFGVYKNENEFSMFASIAINNIWVSFSVFAQGIFFGIFTLKLLLENAIMLGSFQQMFFAKGLGWPSILTIWTHGTIEINAIVIAGTAGLILGTSFLFPGTNSRMYAFVNGAKDAVKILIALIPFFLIAAFLEGYITRHTELHWSISISILLGSEALVIFYFVLYPLVIKRNGITVKNGELFIHNQKVVQPI